MNIWLFFYQHWPTIFLLLLVIGMFVITSVLTLKADRDSKITRIGDSEDE